MTKPGEQVYRLMLAIVAMAMVASIIAPAQAAGAVAVIRQAGQTFATVLRDLMQTPR
jgi:hypothetical protein